MATNRDANWIETLQAAGARKAARAVMRARDAVRKAAAEARNSREAPHRQHDTRVLATYLTPVLLELAAETLLDAEADGSLTSVRNWVEQAAARSADDAIVELAGVLRELIEPRCQRKRREERTVLQIVDRMLAPAGAQRDGAGGERMNEHTMVVGGHAADRASVLAKAMKVASGDGDIETVRLDGWGLAASGTEAIWRAAADKLRGAAGDEDASPLRRLLERDTETIIGIFIDDLETLITRWRDRDDIWALRRVLQSEGRIILAATAETWPPAGTTGRDSGAYGSFATAELRDGRRTDPQKHTHGVKSPEDEADDSRIHAQGRPRHGGTADRGPRKVHDGAEPAGGRNAEALRGPRADLQPEERARALRRSFDPVGRADRQDGGRPEDRTAPTPYGCAITTR